MVTYYTKLSCPPRAAKGLSLTATITQESKEDKKGAGKKKWGGREAGRNTRRNEGINKG